MMCCYVLFPSNEWNYLSGIVRWVRFPKHILLFSRLFQLEPKGFWNSYNWVQRVVSENLRLSKRLTYNYARIERGYD